MTDATPIPAADRPAMPLAALVDALRAAGLLAAPVDAAGVDVRALADDSRGVRPGTLFIARAGDHTDGHRFLAAALAAGAAAAVVDAARLDEATVAAEAAAQAAARLAPPPGPSGPTEPLGKGERLPGAVLVPVSDTRAALGEVATAFFGHPSHALALVGVTGTNGKTTTAFLLHHLLGALGGPAGLIGTVENRVGEERIATAYTTPEAIELNGLLRRMADAGCTACAMEVSSHGLALDRVRGLRFAGAVFTNLTHDHLDFHGSLAAYRDAKRRLFDGLGADAFAVVNADDPEAAAMVARTAARVVTYGTGPAPAFGAEHVRVEVLENALAGLRLRLDGHERRFRLAGAFNALNLAAAYAVGRALGHDADAVLGALADAPGVPGRFETFASADGVLGVVDYAHTPDALENVLRTARALVAPAGRLHVVVGCGGDRDRAKRPVMGRAAEALADRVVVTDDNPRTEDAAAIRAAVRAGMDRPEAAAEIGDRAAAIAAALAEAAPGDVVVVAGKGHEDYQIVGAEKRPFDDRALVREALDARAAGAATPTPAEEAR